MLYQERQKLRLKKITLTVFKVQKLPDIEETDREEEKFCLKGQNKKVGE